MHKIHKPSRYRVGENGKHVSTRYNILSTELALHQTYYGGNTAPLIMIDLEPRCTTQYAIAVQRW